MSYEGREEPMETSPEQVRVRLRIEGRVQGVYFRASTVQQARRLDLTGWVMNCPDGSVEVVAEGARPNTEELIAWCHRGPPGAIVNKVSQCYEAYKGEFQRFGILR